MCSLTDRIERTPKLMAVLLIAMVQVTRTVTCTDRLRKALTRATEETEYGHAGRVA